jgi:hypothetical protein
MSRMQESEEVRVLRFFEEASIETAEAVYNIVSARINARRALSGANNATQGDPPTRCSPVERKRSRRNAPTTVDHNPDTASPTQIDVAQSA